MKEFESKEDAERAVALEKVWKRTSVQKTFDGEKVIFRCIAGKYRVAECPVGVYLLYHSDSAKVSFFKTDCSHKNHDSHPSKGLPHDLKTFIREKFEEGIRKPNAVLHAIKCSQKFSEPPKNQVVCFLQQIRSKTYDQATVSGRDITQWCEERLSMPSCKDEPFVLKYRVHAETFIPDEQDLKIVLSTVRLLENLKNSSMVQTDATYKVV